MKKTLIALCVVSALVISAQAEEKKKEGSEKPKRPQLTEEQKSAKKALLEKYDANKDGKLDKEERAKIPADELEKAGFAKKKAAEAAK